MGPDEKPDPDTDPAPVDPAPVDPAPVDPAPVDPAPIPLSSINPAGPTQTTSTGGSGGGTPLAVTEIRGLEKTRARIAYFVLFILAGVIILNVALNATFSFQCSHLDTAEKCKVLEEASTIISAPIQNIFTAIIGLVGSVIGFYFGSQKSGD